MAKFQIECVRRITERETITFEAATLAEALNMAANAYLRGATEDAPYEYRWDDCGDVTDLEFAAFNEREELLIQDLSLGEAEDATQESLAADYGVTA